MAQDIGARVVVHIFNRIDFAIAKGVGPRYCVRAPHAQDFLSTIPIDGVGQRMNHRQFRFVLCYRLAVPMFSEGNLCPGCNVHQMDQWGDHVVHCSSEVGVKFRHNPVSDILVDICSEVGIMVRKETPMGFLSDDGNDLRPVDFLLFNWLQGKDACLDVTCISPFAGIGATSWAQGVTLNNVVEKIKRKYASIYEENGYKFKPFCFLYVRGIRYGGFGYTFTY
nr:beta-myrcene synthase [Tanacetum cinerariifolium]